jgi:hypothetical protein
MGSSQSNKNTMYLVVYAGGITKDYQVEKPLGY